MNNIKEINRLARYCESCITKPCQLGCPLNNDITGFIKCIKEKKYKEAYELLSETTVIPSLCGRICPHEKQCEGACVKGVSYEPVQIGVLEAFIGDLAIKNNWKIKSPTKTKYNVAIVGSGPSSLTCAAFLRRNGIGVTIYEQYDYLGGLLVHGIPEFRLDKKLVKHTIDRIINLGIKVKYNTKLGTDITLKELENKYDAVFLGIGANISAKMDIPGEELKGVYGGNELLEHNINLDYKDKTVIISGCGNVAMDVCRSIKRQGAKKVIVIYRRSEKDMPAERKEYEEAKKEGIKFLFNTNILQILGKEKVEKIEVVKNNIIKTDNQEPTIIPSKKRNILCDYVIMAIGSNADSNLVNTFNVDLDKRGKVDIDKLGNTTRKGLFAGGDVAGTKSTVAWAARAGRNAAYEIIKYLENKSN